MEVQRTRDYSERVCVCAFVVVAVGVEGVYDVVVALVRMGNIRLRVG